MQNKKYCEGGKKCPTCKGKKSPTEKKPFLGSVFFFGSVSLEAKGQKEIPAGANANHG
jgi:hypothetical protein